MMVITLSSCRESLSSLDPIHPTRHCFTFPGVFGHTGSHCLCRGVSSGANGKGKPVHFWYGQSEATHCPADVKNHRCHQRLWERSVCPLPRLSLPEPPSTAGWGADGCTNMGGLSTGLSWHFSPSFS